MTCLLRFLILLLFFSFFSLPLLADNLVTQGFLQDRSIILKTGSRQPEWMQLWEQARTAFKNNDDVLAANLYKKLLIEKPHIEEALREYVLVLMNLEQWETAGTELRELLEINPVSDEYQLYAGRVALALHHYKRASTYLGQVYSMDPNGSNALEALRGQIMALEKQELQEMAYPLMEQLYLLVPHDQESIRQLARYSLKLGFKDKAKMYYKTLLSEFGGTDLDYLESEPLFAQADDVEMLIRCWQGYLQYHPNYLPYHIKLSNYYLSSEEKEKALPHILIRITYGDEQPEIFLTAGRLYLYEKGRPDKALYYYDEYKKRQPDDDTVDSEILRIQAILANDLLVIVENEGAWNLWRDLAKVIPDRLAVYYSMAEQLKELDKPKELLEVMEIIHFHNPSDQKTLFTLAQLRFNAGDTEACSQALDSLQDNMKTGKEYFLLRAGVEEKSGDMSRALPYYKAYLLHAHDDYQTILHCMEIAGDIGSIEELHYFYELVPSEHFNRKLFSRAGFLYGDSLVQNCLYSTARIFFTEFIKSWTVKDSQWILLHEKIAQIFQYEESFFEAEQEYRVLLTKGTDKKKYLRSLVKNALQARDWKSAWKWHEFQILDSQDVVTQNFEISRDLFVEKLSILSESGQVAVAIELAEDFLDQHSANLEVRSKLSELYYQNKEFYAARDLLALEKDSDFRLSVLRQLIKEETEISNKDQKLDTAFPLLFNEAKLYKQFGAYKKGLESVKCYLLHSPDSLKGMVLHAEFLQLTNDIFASLALYQKLSEQYPAEQYFKNKILELQFTSARFEDVISNLVPDWAAEKKKGGVLFKRAITPDALLLSQKQKILLARALWATKKHDEALQVYELLLQPPVEQIFSEQLEAAGITLLLPPITRTFLNYVTFTIPPEPDRLSVVMSPEYSRDNLDTQVVKTATELYADYRWQQLVTEELSVRKNMVNGNYYQAMKDYQKMLGQNSSMESLFDLAGIYSQLGFLGKEAALYKKIKSRSPEYPNLDEVMQRNNLKRKPHVLTIFDYEKKEGREGYINNNQQTAGMQSWFMPSLQHEVLLDYRRLYNQSIDGKEELWRNHLLAELKWSPAYDLDFLMRLGGDRSDEEYGTTLLYDFRVNGRLGDTAEGYLGVSQNVVDDTVASLMMGINNTKYAGGLQFDLLPRLFGGGNYLYTNYSDGNHQNKYELWTSYILHPEPTLLKVRYEYALSHNANGNIGIESSLGNLFQVNDHSYWSPKEYWQHLFSVSFKHLLSNDTLGRGAPSYYTLEYSYGLENESDSNHQLSAEIYLEISRHLLLNSSFDYINGDEYEEQEFLFSLIYRW
jgi:hypothetical protein